MLQYEETPFQECFSLELFLAMKQLNVSQSAANVLKHAANGKGSSGTV